MPRRSRKVTRRQTKCPLGLWHVLTNDPLPEAHPEHNAFQEFLRPGDFDRHKAELLEYFATMKPTERRRFCEEHRYLAAHELDWLKSNAKTKHPAALNSEDP